MSGIYIHIPFCKQACYYCDFHFSTSLRKKEEMIRAIANELIFRKNEFQKETVETIYFGGGTPSVLDIDEIIFLIKIINENYNIVDLPEITLEANPDDLKDEVILQLANTPINRLSIGIQSFFDEDLMFMNRAHNAEDAKRCLATAIQYFDNISLDLIYGMPNMSNEKWLQNVQTALSFDVPHISSYALTVEPKTALKKLIEKQLVPAPNDEVAQEHFLVLIEELEKNGFVHYELSNFGKPTYFSKNNTAYWLGKKYIGIGPSAHSYNGKERSWNIANNALYLKAIQEGKRPSEREPLTLIDRYNEYVMTGLRTIWGVSLERVEREFGERYLLYLLDQAKKYIHSEHLQIDADVLTTTKKGKFLSDGIASDLFLLNLE
ncbi:MAG: radical SAM family heme chaperone HemW [Flavobacterium sp.]